ncbi:MAG: Response regulator receiver protein [Parcubacteria group bacterium GW2011_GWC1_45_9]|nr:MAG: Response regulator receiver protein [Parcubacteria group bacterium GW2011_GWA1_Parcubacteria_45_10]KKT89154.1 MAG: Response regulator receiver protein [Parcubacteria group bacterium GW2011_GWB1_45_10]KKU17348.1 MAG: Response regulator receiver protein [Parcubacteria group bacterium GW2011_GWC1_45_9]HCI05253.1 response regulator [Patescibacteria group bacterium]
MTPNEPKQNRSRKTVLIIEDDVFLQKAYDVKFEKEGIELLIASDGDQALAMLAKDPPDLILLDIMLPGISGFDVLEQIRKNDRWKSVPVLILSNLGQAEDIEKGKKLGVKEYIIKANAKINEVIELVRKYLA